MSEGEGRGATLGEIFEMFSDFFVAPEPPPKRPRRKTKTRERRQPCRLCFYPLSQRHHLLEVAHHGENGCTVQLCANCHELFHIAHGAWFKKDHHLDIFTSLWKDGRISKDHMGRAIRLAEYAILIDDAVRKNRPRPEVQALAKQISDFLDRVFDEVARPEDKVGWEDAPPEEKAKISENGVDVRSRWAPKAGEAP